MIARSMIIATAVTMTAIGMCSPVHAAKAKFERNKPHVNVGTIGHTLGLPHEHQNPQFQNRGSGPSRHLGGKLKKIDTSNMPIVVCPNPQDAYPGC